ncbi:MAG TPA: D-hexose-6-phosphate mutarotase [Gammaproteobacteria bacterium]|nr:D-hexose-6-phosphate mutarotase [Gammaproteobacteria bacterium]
MNTETVAELNTRFGICERVTFSEMEGGLLVAEVRNEQATARVALQGAQVLDWTPVGGQPVLWVSPGAIYTAGKSVRGGVPVCWPWFGPHATEAGFPAHGFARTQCWEMVQVQQLSDGSTTLSLRLLQDADTRRLWPHEAALLLLVNVGEGLQMDLLTRNTGSEVFTVTQALHTYFAVSDVREVSVRGLEDVAYIDKVADGARGKQSGPVTFSAETDCIYLDQGAECVIDDPGLQRRIIIRRKGSRSMVVWNPWVEKSAAMVDMGEGVYRGMLCVEASNAAEDAVRIEPGGEHRLQVSYRLATL